MKSTEKKEITFTLNVEEAKHLHTLLNHEDKTNLSYYQSQCYEILRALTCFLEK